MTSRVPAILKACGVVVLGMLGMGLWQAGASLYADWAFLRTARLQVEQQAKAAAAAPAPTQAPSATGPAPQAPVAK